MTLWGEPERVHVQNMEQLHVQTFLGGLTRIYLKFWLMRTDERVHDEHACVQIKFSCDLEDLAPKKETVRQLQSINYLSVL